MLISQTSTDEVLVKIGNVMEQLAREAATKVVEQPHYWREGQLTISKSDLVTDITYEVKKVLVDLFMKGMGMAPMNGSASE